MADNKKVEAITSMDVDFAQWYTDVERRTLRLCKRKGLYGNQACGLCNLGEYPEGAGPQI